MSIQLFRASAHHMPMIPDQSCHVIVCSPPYYSLRSYSGEQSIEWPTVEYSPMPGLPPIRVQGCEPGCEHEWVDGPVRVVGNNSDIRGKDETDNLFGGSRKAREDGNQRSVTGGVYCRHCLGWRGALGLEPSIEDYIGHLVLCLREWHRILRADGTCWVNLGDSYSSGGTMNPGAHTGLSAASERADGIPRNPQNKATQNGAIAPVKRTLNGLKPKNLMMIPARFALAAQAEGWIIRSAITWVKGNPMPESVTGSHYFRHRVTIQEYENLSSLRREQRRDTRGIGDLPILPTGAGTSRQAPLPPEREGSSGAESTSRTRGRQRTEATLSTEREGQSNGAGAGRTRGRKGKAQTVQPIPTRTVEQSQVRSNGEGQSDEAQSNPQVQGNRGIQATGRRTASENERFTHSDSSEERGERTLHSLRKGQSEKATRLCQAQSGDSSGSPVHGGGLAGDRQAAQEPLLLLQEEADTNDRPCDSSEQGRVACEGEYSTSLQELQLEEEGQADPALLVDCPGCPKCEKHGGYILAMSAGRPTKATEQIFLLTKSPSYYFDSEAIKTESGANSRDWWHVNSQPTPFAHFAVFPSRIPEIAILAGTSARGVCPQCGAGWVRVTDKGPEKDGIERGKHPSAHRSNLQGAQRSANGGLGTRVVETTGWAASCSCNAGEPVAAVVCDPFSGSGTTGKVALRLGRDYVGVDISNEYLTDITAQRLGDGIQMEISY